MKRRYYAAGALFLLALAGGAHANAGAHAGSGGNANSGGNAGKADLGTLAEINIEGEIPLPQVLFISSREQPRYPDTTHKRYLTDLDSWLSRPIFPLSIITVPKGLDQQEEY
jgi:hypothetical protein